jgi:CheY-like chemotaxis protein
MTDQEAHGPGDHPDRERRVLVVDDSEIVRDLFRYGISKYFRRRDERVEIDGSADGLSAWGLLRERPYDLVVVDCYLPVLDGAKLVSRIRRDDRLRALPVVAMSVGGDEARELMMTAGADLFLAKPVVLRDLFATLDSLSVSGDPPEGRRHVSSGGP